MKAAVIGAGCRGKHAQEYAGPGFEVSVCRPDPAAARAGRKWAKTLTPAQILDDRAMGHAGVCAPDCRHYPLGARVPANSKHLLVEKPVCQTPPQARKLQRPARAGGAKLLCGHRSWFNNAVRRVNDVISECALGRVRQTKFTRQTLDFVRDRSIVTDVGLCPAGIADLRTGGRRRLRRTARRGRSIRRTRSAILNYDVRPGGRVNVTAGLNFAAPAGSPGLGIEKVGARAVQSQQINEYGGERERRGRCEANNMLRVQQRYFTESSRSAILSGDKANGATASRALHTLRKVERRRQ